MRPMVRGRRREAGEFCCWSMPGRKRERGLPRELPGGCRTLEEKITIDSEAKVSRTPAGPGAKPVVRSEGSQGGGAAEVKPKSWVAYPSRGRLRGPAHPAGRRARA